jgi:hypothetical protein
MVVKSSLSVLACLVVAWVGACSASSGRESETTGGNGGSGNAGGNGGSGAILGSGGTGAINVNDTGTLDEPEECGGETFPLERKPAKMLFVLDRSGSMDDPPEGGSGRKWDLVTPAVKRVITNTNASIAWGLKTYGEGVGVYCKVTDSILPCTPGPGGCAGIDVPIAPNNELTVNGAVDATQPDGDGTPTGEVMAVAVKYLQSLDAAGDTDAKSILLATDGEPSCMNGSEASQDSARPYAVAAVAAANTAGYKTFVVGVNTTKENATLALNEMAVAGGMSRPDPNPLATKFYLANTESELVDALTRITGVVASCTFTLAEAPAPNERVGVRVDGRPVMDWTIGADRRTIQISGETCEQIKNGTIQSVRVAFGCPSDPPVP